MARLIVNTNTSRFIRSHSGKMMARPAAANPPAFTTPVLAQIAGTSNQARVTFTFTGRRTGTLYVKFKESYAAHGKSDGGFTAYPVDDTVTAYDIPSGATITPASSVTVMLYWEELSPVAAAVEQFPTGNAVTISNTVAMITPETAATSITPTTISATVGTVSGTVVGQLVANSVGGTYSEQAPDNALITVSASGVVTAAATLTPAGNSTIKARHVSQGGTYTYNQDVTLSLSAASATDPAIPTASVTVSTTATLYAQLDAWIASPSTSQRCVGFNGNVTGGWDFSGYNFSVAAGHGGVVIRGIGTFTENDTGPMASCKVSDGVLFGNANNLSVVLMQCAGISHMNTSTDCGFKYCCVEGANRITSAANYASAAFTSGVALYFDTATRPFLYRCALMGAQNQLLNFGGGTNTGVLVSGCVTDQTQGDFVRTTLSSNLISPIFEWNLSAYRQMNAGAQHSDHFQVKGPITNGIFRYNLFHHRQEYGVDTYNNNQILFFGTGSEASTGCSFTQNFSASNNGHPEGNLSNSTVTYCTAVATIPLPGSGYNAGNISIEGTSRDYNITQTASNRSAGAGPNGEYRNLVNGDTSGATILDLLTLSPTKTSGAGNFKPVVGSRAHWLNANPCGSYDLMRLCFHTTQHNNWMDWGWPVRPLAKVTLDGALEFASSYGTSSTYDANGRSI
jgi:hypothetical protein